MSRLIGIGGGTGAGKGVLASAFAALHPGEVTLIEYDWYYRDQQHLTEDQRARVNYDHPDALETELLVEQLQQLLAGHPVQAPRYDFSRHTRKEAAQQAEPRPFLILEGIHALVDPQLRALMSLKVFMDCPPSLRLSRRIQRDVAERGRSLESVLHQYQNDVEPMHAQFVEQSRVHADVVLSGKIAPEENAKRLLSLL